MTYIHSRGLHHEAEIQGKQVRIKGFRLYQCASVVCPEFREFKLETRHVRSLELPTIIFRRNVKYDGKFFAKYHFKEQMLGIRSPEGKDVYEKFYKLYMPYEFFSFRIQHVPRRFGFQQRIFLTHTSDKFGVSFDEKMLSENEVEPWKEDAIKVFGKRIRITKAIERLTKKENECEDRLCHLDPQGAVERAHKIAQETILKSIKKGDD